MKIALKIFAVLVLGTVLGLLATLLFAMHGTMPGGASDGPWKTNLLIGSNNGDMKTRAAVALHGLFALNRNETIYYTATTDSEGNKLDGRCTYFLNGHDLPARWWSITAYGADDFLIPNAGHHYSISKDSIIRDKYTNSFTITVSGNFVGWNRIYVAQAPFTLTLRLYNPAPSVVADPAHVPLPSIKKGSCP